MPPRLCQSSPSRASQSGLSLFLKRETLPARFALVSTALASPCINDHTSTGDSPRLRGRSVDRCETTDSASTSPSPHAPGRQAKDCRVSAQGFPTPRGLPCHITQAFVRPDSGIASSRMESSTPRYVLVAGFPPEAASLRKIRDAIDHPSSRRIKPRERNTSLIDGARNRPAESRKPPDHFIQHAEEEHDVWRHQVRDRLSVTPTGSPPDQGRTRVRGRNRPVRAAYSR